MSNKPLLHYSASPIEKLKRVKELQEMEPHDFRVGGGSERWRKGDGWVYKQDFRAMKPNGFWVSVGRDWQRWCEGEDWNMLGLANVYEVKLAKTANILRLSTELEIDNFTKDYTSGLYAYGLEKIDWAGVAGRYQGIIIAPYCWSRRLAMHTFWYYPWDCASGCIWDLTAVHSLKPYAEQEEAVCQDEASL